MDWILLFSEAGVEMACSGPGTKRGAPVVNPSDRHATLAAGPAKHDPVKMKAS